MKYYRQIDETDCGPACIAMVASYYNLFITIGKVRELCKTDYIGTNLAGMKTAAENLGFTANAMRGEVNEATLNQKIIFPFIAHVRVPYDNNKLLDHYVIVTNIDKNKVTIWDPDFSRGKHKLNRLDFLKIWTGYVLFLSPSTTFVTEKNQKNNLLKYLPLVLPHRKNLIIVSLSSAVLIVFGIITSNYYKYVMDEIIISKAAFTLTALSIGVILITVIQSIFEGLRSILINYFSFKTDLQLNFSYITHIFKLRLSFFDSRKTGEILSRLNDISRIREMLSGTALSLIFDIVLIIIVGPVLFKINSTLFAISIANVILMSIIILFFSKIFRNYYVKLRRQEAEVNSTLVEAIKGAYTIKTFNAEKNIGKIYEEKQMQAIWTGWKTSRLGIWQRFFAGLINGLTTIIIFWVGSSGIIKDTFSFGTLLSFNALLTYFTGPLFRMINIQPQIQEASVAAERVSEILEMEVEQSEELKLIEPPKLEGNIEFKNVFFKYGMRSPIYTDLSFKIDKGQWAAFVGPSGCGKTTLIKLLLKFYEPEKGTVFIDGHDLRYINATTLRSRIGYVPQDIYLYAGTIAENIALGNPNATMDTIIEAAKKADAHEFINLLPEQYETKLSEHGSTLSGGEKQRLALARALLENHDIIILDEATSNLDTISERSIHKAIEKLRGNITSIIIAHRLTTIQNCDIIFVMDKGNIVEFGNHKELLAKNGLYKRLWEETVI
jgi:ATP-binding cassette, subfamily C, bacteriocin exporter